MPFYEQQLEELTEQYRAAVTRANELQGMISEISATATAPREVVKVTVGARGEVRAVEFPTSAYKRMAPAELAATLMSTIDEANEKALAAYSDLMRPELPKGMDVVGLLKGTADGSALLPEEPAMLDAVREYVAHGRGPRLNGAGNG
jgi:DNA-binding protein YbaB